nr:MAG TPA: hypothetical protein [Caudoviricetes sp.]
MRKARSMNRSWPHSAKRRKPRMPLSMRSGQTWR